MGALDGIRVLEVGLLVQGPQAAALLHDMGADVVKVELPNIGDQSRWVVPKPGMTESGFFWGSNRGKRSVTLDLRKPAGRDVFLRLAQQADVVISNFKPGTMDEWGVGYEHVSQLNPKVIYGMGSAFGPIGPDALREGADIAGQAAGGLISTTGSDGGQPTPVGVTIADHIASQHLAAGLLAALFSRERTGQGQRVDVSLLGGQIWAQASEYSGYFLSGEIPGRSNGGHPLINGAYGIVATADGWLAIVGVPTPFRQAFADAVGIPDLFQDPRFSPSVLTHADKVALFAELGRVFQTRTTSEWMEILRAIGVRYAPVRNYAEVAADPQVWENGYLTTTQHPTRGEMTMVGTPIRMSGTPLVPGLVPPELGQHTEEVLLEAGYEWEAIAALRETGAI